MRKSCFGQTCRSKISICNSKATFLKHGCFSSLSKSRVFVSEPRALKNISDLIFITSDSNCMGSMSKLIDNVFTTTSICFRSLKIKFIVIDFETFRDRDRPFGRPCTIRTTRSYPHTVMTLDGPTYARWTRTSIVCTDAWQKLYCYRRSER